MANDPKEPKDISKLVYSMTYNTLYTAVESPRVHKSLSEKSWYELRQASDDYVSRMAEILEKEGFEEDEDITVKLIFEKK